MNEGLLPGKENLEYDFNRKFHDNLRTIWIRSILMLCGYQKEDIYFDTKKRASKCISVEYIL